MQIKTRGIQIATQPPARTWWKPDADLFPQARRRSRNSPPGPDPSALHRDVPGHPAGRDPDGCGLPAEYFAARGHQAVETGRAAPGLPVVRAGEGAVAAHLGERAAEAADRPDLR